MEDFGSSKKKLVFIGSILTLVVGVLLFTYVYKKTHVVTVTTNVPTSTPTAIPIQATPKPVSVPVSKPVILPDAQPLPVGTDRFIVSLIDTSTNVAANLVTAGYVNNEDSFVKLLDAKGAVEPGAYKISKSMTPAQLVRVLEAKPYMAWVVIPEGLRKEEIAVLLGNALGWSKKTEKKWITTDTVTDAAHTEGVFFPDTYLIPVDEKPALVATRLIDKFNEIFAPALIGFNQQNTKWTTGLTLASLVQREAANDADMPLIAGILWNRLNQKMPLDVDATLQYVRGDVGKGWWAPITIADKQLDSPYNTYKHAGLPPHPIANPGLPAIMAVLNPTKTDCLYYLHDSAHVTHCAATYEEHLANIKTYLQK